MKLDGSLDNFVETQMDINNYWQIVTYKYQALDFREASQVMEIIDKFKRKHLDIKVDDVSRSRLELGQFVI